MVWAWVMGMGEAAGKVVAGEANGRRPKQASYLASRHLSPAGTETMQTTLCTLAMDMTDGVKVSPFFSQKVLPLCLLLAGKVPSWTLRRRSCVAAAHLDDLPGQLKHATFDVLHALSSSPSLL